MCIEDEEGIRHCKLIAAHAGLEEGKNVGEQLRFLKAKETHVPKIEALSGRKTVWDIPKVMARYLLLIFLSETFYHNLPFSPAFFSGKGLGC